MNNDPLSIDDTVLLAYVGGELTAGQRAEVEAALAQSRVLTDRVVAAAFRCQAVPPAPQSLTEKVNNLIRVGRV